MKKTLGLMLVVAVLVTAISALTYSAPPGKRPCATRAAATVILPQTATKDVPSLALIMPGRTTLTFQSTIRHAPVIVYLGDQFGVASFAKPRVPPNIQQLE